MPEQRSKAINWLEVDGRRQGCRNFHSDTVFTADFIFVWCHACQDGSQWVEDGRHSGNMAGHTLVKGVYEES